MISLGGNVLAHDELAPLLTNVEELTPHIENPKNGDVDAIEESITINGLYRPLYIDQTGTILAGNHTYHAAVGLGATQLPVIRLDVDLDGGRRILLGDNRISDLGRYDDGLLLALLERMDTSETGLAGTGYAEDDMELLRLAGLGAAPQALGHDVTGDLILHGLPLEAIAAFRELPGDDDRDRFLRLVSQADTSDSGLGAAWESVD
jgi:hypothetical protein